MSEVFQFRIGRLGIKARTTLAHLEPITCDQLRHRLLSSDEFAAREKVIGHVSKWVITEIFDGSAKIWVDLADKYVAFGCLIDDYEPLETAAFRRLLRPGPYRESTSTQSRSQAGRAPRVLSRLRRRPCWAESK